MELREYLSAARRNRLLLLALVALGALGGLVFSVVAPASYKATSEVYVSARNVSSVGDLGQGDAFTQSVVAGYAHVATTPYVLDGVIQALDLPVTSDALAKSLTVAAVPNAAVVQITATNPSPSTAAAIANAVAGRLSTAVPSLTPDLANGAPIVKVTQIRSALRPTSGSGPARWLAIALGALVGAFLGLVAMIVRESLDRRIRSVDELERLAPSPVLGTIPRSSLFGKVRPVQTEASETLEAESFRTLRASVETAIGPAGTGVVVATAASAGAGTTTTVVNLALAFAAANRRVVVVDADLRSPGVAAQFGVRGITGLTDVLRGDLGVSAAVQETGLGVDVLSAGTGSLRPSELLASDRTVEMFHELLTYYHLVIIDSPSLGAVADAAVVARVATATVLVAAVERTTRPRLQAALASLRRSEVRPVGLVATMAPIDRRELRRYNRAAPADVLLDARHAAPARPDGPLDVPDWTSTSSS